MRQITVDVLAVVLEEAATEMLVHNSRAPGARSILEKEGPENVAERIVGKRESLFSEGRNTHEVPLAKGIWLRWESYSHRKTVKVKVFVLCDVEAGVKPKAVEDIRQRLKDLPVRNLLVG